MDGDFFDGAAATIRIALDEYARTTSKDPVTGLYPSMAQPRLTPSSSGPRRGSAVGSARPIARR